MNKQEQEDFLGFYLGCVVTHLTELDGTYKVIVVGSYQIFAGREVIDFAVREIIDDLKFEAYCSSFLLGRCFLWIFRNLLKLDALLFKKLPNKFRRVSNLKHQ